MAHANRLPKELKTTLYVHANAMWPEHLSVWDTDMSERGYILLTTKEVTFQIPEFDIVNGQIQVLRAEKQKILAEAQMRANQIDERIQSLLAIEHKG